jgi:transposase-like protein
MKRKRYSDEEKAVLINKLLNGESLSSVSQEAGVNSVLLSRWRKEYRDNGRFGYRQTGKSDAVVTFKEAQIEIKHLRKQLENKTLEVMVLRDMLKKNEIDNQ